MGLKFEFDVHGVLMMSQRPEPGLQLHGGGHRCSLKCI